MDSQTLIDKVGCYPARTISIAMKLSKGKDLTREDKAYIADRFAEGEVDTVEELLLGGETARAWTKGYRTEPPWLQSKTFPGDPSSGAFDGWQNPELTTALVGVLGRQVARILKRLDELVVVEKLTPEDIDKILPEGEREKWIEEVAKVARPHLEKTIKDAGLEALVRTRVDAGESVVGLTFDLRNRRAATYLEDATRRIGTDAVTVGWRDEIRAALVEAVDAGMDVRRTKKLIEEKTSNEIRGFRAERLARTETAFAHINATEMGWQESGVVLGKRFVLAPDACPFCVAIAEELGEKSIPLGQSFFDLGKELKAEFELQDGTKKERTMVLDYSPDGRGLTIPPVHPNCRCDVLPVLPDEAE